MDNNISKDISNAIVQVEKPWLAMAGLLIGAFMGMFSETALNIALPSLATAFHKDPGTLQWLVTGYMLVIGIVLPFSSLITKWFKTRSIVLFSLAAFTIGSLISGFASNFSILLIGRMIQGIGTGLILPLMFTVAMLIFPPAKIGTAMGVNAMVIMFAPVIGPTLTGIILGALSWRYIFFIFAIVCIIGLIIAFFCSVNVGKITRPKVDVLSIILSVIGFSSVVAGTGLSEKSGWASVSVICLLVIGIVALVFYAHRQLHLDSPILNLHVFRKSAFAKSAILVMLDFGIILSSMYLLPQYLQNGMGIPVSMAGIIMLPGGIVNAVVSAISGRLYDNYGAKMPARIGFIIAILGIFMLALGTKNSSVAYVIAAHIIIMIGAPLALSPSQTHGLNALEGLESSDGSTIMNTLQQVVGALATSLTTSFLSMGQAAYTGKDSAASFTNGVHYGLYFALALAIVGFIISLTLKNKKDVRVVGKDINQQN